ncbi:MAG: Gldg family protein [Phycisphaerales bacterium]|nr:Gldg family protein [Phycisphaerales bacterium]
MLVSRALGAVLRRNFTAYFINPTGYVFITVFILLSAIAAFWQSAFFFNNLANLDQLNGYFPLLILFFVPALTMNVWSEERRAGTDELLFTLPARDLDIVLGKYLAVLGIYTVAIMFSLSHVAILSWLGDPDLGLLAATYLGYWLVGMTLLSVGMVGSYLARNATIAFIIGALLCSTLVFMSPMQQFFGRSVGALFGQLGLEPHFESFANGAISGSALVYFFAVTIIMLSINVWMVGRRRQSSGRRISAALGQGLLRLAAMIVIAASVFMLVDRSGAMVDATSEHLHTVQPQTRAVVAAISEDQPVFVQAFISRDVPDSFVGMRKSMLNILKRIDDLGGNRVQVIVHDTERYTEVATDASENYGIEPVRMTTLRNGQRVTATVYFGLVFTSGPNEFVIPYFDPGLPIEYELARSIRTVSQSARKVIGILSTDVEVFGGLDFQFRVNRPDWSIVSELRKQYDVRPVNAAGPYPADLDALVAIMPSTLTQPELDVLRAAILRGVPTLIFDDPFPRFNLNMAPSQPKRPPMDAAGRPTGQPVPKGNFDAFLSDIGLSWRSNAVVWSSVNPHPGLAEAPPEIVFVVNHPDNEHPFNEHSLISSGLQELVMLYPGFVAGDREVNGAELTRTPLVRTGAVSGEVLWDALMIPTRTGAQLNPDPQRFQSPDGYTLAMQVTGTVPNEAPSAVASADDAEAPPAGSTEINVIMVADADIISETFFQFRRQGIGDLTFDNVTFALNCIDVLAGDEAFVALRKHRARHRTLTRVEAESRTF